MTASLCFEHIDPKVRVVELSDLPRPSSAVPEPIVLADESRKILSYEEYDTSQWVIVQFLGCSSLALGRPNDEAIDGHPFYRLGLEPYGSYEIKNSPWIQALERANRVHSQHNPDAYIDTKHYIIVFHDSTFECVAADFIVHAKITDRSKVLDEMLKMWRALDR